MNAYRGRGAGVFLLVAFAACVSPATAPPIVVPSSGATPAGSSRAVLDLESALNRLFNDPLVAPIVWGVDIHSLDRNKRLYSLNANTLLMPASTMKIVTLAAAAERLGWDYQYETHLLTSAAIDSGVLTGDLIVRGTGDPTVNAGWGSSDGLFDRWASELQAMGVHRIDGRIIGDDDVLDGTSEDAKTDRGLGAGWSWDDLALGFATPVGALQHHENVVNLTVRPGATAGMAGTVQVDTSSAELTLVNRVMTVPKDGPFAVRLLRFPGQSRLAVTGTIPVGARPLQRTASVDNPTTFFVRALRDRLQWTGIAVAGTVVDIDDLSESARKAAGRELRRLATHRSPPLTELASNMMKRSQNLYAETILRTLGVRAGGSPAAAGRREITEVLASWKIRSDQAIVADGSGLSRYNYLAPAALVKILSHMHAHPRHAMPFRASLPIVGREGTVKTRMKETAAEANARAKTGSMANVRALAGYVSTRDGEQLAFAILANNFHAPPADVTNLIDRAVEALATFSQRVH